MAKSRNMVTRSLVEWKKFCDDVGVARVKKNLEKKTISKPEVERMILSLNKQKGGFIFQEVTTQPRKKEYDK